MMNLESNHTWEGPNPRTRASADEVRSGARNRLVVIAAASLVLVLIAGSAPAAEKPLKVFVLAGQSNMQGLGNPAELPKDLQGEQKKVPSFDGKQWVPLAPAQTFGPEIAFAARMSARFGEPIGIIKFFSGGTNLAKQWDPKNPGALYARMVATIKAAKEARKIEIAGMVWMQGESDALDAAMARDYAANLEAFIKVSRKDFGGSGMAFVAGRINPPMPRFVHAEPVRKAIETCKLPNYAFVNCDKLTKNADNLHYNAKGLVDLGNAFADAMIKMLKAKPGSTPPAEEAVTNEVENAEAK